MKTTSDSPGKEYFWVRNMDSKLKYLAEIAARTQQRSLTDFVEGAIAQALRDVPMSNEPGAPSVADMGSKLWNPDRDKRIVYLAANHFDLLTYGEMGDLKRIFRTYPKR